ncbi:antirepressor AbbA [Pseudalkalibacillus sp. SCS-8]|uniref:antirepressor AbbA n=1 Tax=Pseudalkalibacillus nanhaiensis TaxID=3115291 RepID=UPI0032D9CA2A
MGAVTNVRLSSEEKQLLLDVVMEQRYASELVSSEITDIETGQKSCEEERVRELNQLLLRLHKAGV